MSNYDFLLKYDSNNVLLIRDQPYLVEVWMYNQLAKFKPFNIPVYFIEELNIEETIHNFYTSGSITLLNDYEIFERGALSQTYKNSKGDKSTKLEQIMAPFLFRSDGRNKISIRIKPIPSDDNNNVYSDQQWQMSYDFIVYEIEDLDTDNPQKKLKKLNFVDERYQILLERNIQWSTNLYNNGKTIATTGLPNTTNNSQNRKDSSNTMSASEAMKSIITTACSDNSNPQGNIIKIGSPDGPKGLSNPTYPVNNFSSNWDTGSSDSYLQYTSPANSNALEDIEYVFSCLKGSDGSPCFLTLDRHDVEGGKQFSLIPLSQYFNNAQKNQIERLFIQDGVDNASSPPYVPRAPVGYNVDPSTFVNFQSPLASRITSYEFVPMTTADDFALNNSVIHSFDFSKGEFNIEFAGNKATDLYTNIKKYTGGLFGYNKSKQLLLNINQTKQKGLSFINKFVAKNFRPRQMEGVAMMYKFLLLNQTISFTAGGLTFRAPGNFVFIDRDTSTDEKNPFDDKALGQWLITKINHVFTKNYYINNVIAVKVDAFNKWWDVLDPETTTTTTGTTMNNY